MAISGLPDQVTPGPALSGGEGGQAVVYEILGHPTYVLKVYKTAISPQDYRRIDRIIALADPRVLRGAAWPLKRYDQQGKVALLLPRVDHAEPIHVLFERRSWVGLIPDMDWRFVVAVAERTAQACVTVHEAGLVVVDISDKNVLVTRSGDVTLIDCDSFVFEGAGQDGMSPVASPGWLPPELIGKSLGLIPRTANHDNFALARLVFKLLMNGSDPMGPPLGHDADTTRERVFVFSQKIGHRPPAPFELTLAALPRGVADLFEQAFAAPNAGRINRPKAADWVVALGAMARQLRQCPVAPRHFYVPSPGATCPWCGLAARNAAFDPYRGRVAAAVRTGAAWLGLLTILAAMMRGAGRILLINWRPVLMMGVLVTMALLLYSKISSETSPHAVPSTSAIREKTLNEKIVEFISEYFKAYASEADPTVAVQHAHADDVCYYGHMKANADVVDALISNVSSWPARSYVPDFDKINIKCEESSLFCTVIVDVNFKIWTSEHKIHNFGLWRYVFVINTENNEFKIENEGCVYAKTHLKGVNKECGLNTINCFSQ